MKVINFFIATQVIQADHYTLRQIKSPLTIYRDVHIDVALVTWIVKSTSAIQSQSTPSHGDMTRSYRRNRRKRAGISRNKQTTKGIPSWDSQFIVGQKAEQSTRQQTGRKITL